nr:hypothetical protein [Deltaproteobacteria bacterium]
MIAEPVNDRKCLSKITEIMRALVADRAPELVELASRFPTTADVDAWIRSMPQRDDVGDPSDGPKVLACSPPQRLRIAAPDMNCVERSATRIVLAELIDPGPTRALVTIDVPEGRHTFPIEDGEPVVLDPLHTRNALVGALFKLDRGPVAITPSEAADWIATLAQEPAQKQGDAHKVRNARSAMRRVFAGKPISDRSVDDVAYTVAVADGEAKKFGRRGRALHHQTAGKLATALAAQRATRNAGSGLSLGGLRIKPDLELLGALARVGGRLGVQIGSAALQTQLAKLGIGS